MLTKYTIFFVLMSKPYFNVQTLKYNVQTLKTMLSQIPDIVR
jgi:hypothetical protein